jgi:hypothetical protein
MWRDPRAEVGWAREPGPRSRALHLADWLDCLRALGAPPVPGPAGARAACGCGLPHRGSRESRSALTAPPTWRPPPGASRLRCAAPHSQRFALSANASACVFSRSAADAPTLQAATAAASYLAQIVVPASAPPRLLGPCRTVAHAEGGITNGSSPASASPRRALRETTSICHVTAAGGPCDGRLRPSLGVRWNNP